MATRVVEAAKLARRYGYVTALRGADLLVEAGEAVAILGPNGAGKSTLLRLIATLLRPSSGHLRLFGRPVRDGGIEARRRLGFLSHQSFLYPDLSVLENLQFYARMFGVEAPAQRIHELIELVGLSGWRHRPVRTLSRGLEQRCALARSLVHSPQVLLLDEPFTGLDLEATAALTGILRHERAAGTTLLITTHDLPRAEAICRRALVLRQGEVCFDGVMTAPFEPTYHRLTHAPAVHA
jgi:heme exporter protein A